MAAIDDLLEQISDENLRSRLVAEIGRLKDNKQFGLVWETHQPENAQLPGYRIHKGTTVALRDGSTKDSRIMTVVSLNKSDETALCKFFSREKNGELVEKEETFPLADLIAVAKCGEPIYPTLKPIDKVCNAPDSSLWHTLIEADNYHALQLLAYLYPGQVDCIYIDPPYNTGARDWKYNNDYVDSSDKYRHSKWLSMIQARLELAKKLLNPKDSVLIVTIDEKEYLHLGCLLEQMFPEARIQMVSSVVNPSGATRNGQFSRTDEYIFFVQNGSAVTPLPLSEDWLTAKSTGKDKIRWRPLRRQGAHDSRYERPGLFYPIWIHYEKDKAHLKIGESLPKNQPSSEVALIKGAHLLLPIKTDGSDGCWQIGQGMLKELWEQGYVKVQINKNGIPSLSYLAEGERKKIISGVFPIVGKDVNGTVITSMSDLEAPFIPGSQWRISSHSAREYGSSLLSKFIGRKFPFPKSLYAVHDAIRFFVANKPNALIVDFFAGSGTTLHAVNLLNAEDGGNRRCIMVTNNEVGENEEKILRKRGLRPGDEEWEKLGIARYVNWPRTVCSIKGVNVNGQPIKGNYIGSDRPMAEGFEANCEFFKLEFLDKREIALGRAFCEIFPLLWLKAGAKGVRPEIGIDEELPAMYVLPENNFAVLVNEDYFPVFLDMVNEHPEIEHVFIVTDSNRGFQEMALELSGRTTYQLYRDYLDNFRLNFKDFNSK